MNTQTFWDEGNTSTLRVMLRILSLCLKADEIIQSKELRSTLLYVLSLPRRMAAQTHALSVNNKLSHMISDMCNMKSAYWSVPVLLSSVLSESAVDSTPLRNSLFPRCQDCEQLISTGCDETSLPWDCGPSQSTYLSSQSIPTLLCWQWMKWNAHLISHLVHRACHRSQLVRWPGDSRLLILLRRPTTLKW